MPSTASGECDLCDLPGEGANPINGKPAKQ